MSALAATLFFSVNDSSIKFLSGDYALHQVVLVRSTIGMLLLLALIFALHRNFSVLRTQRLGMHLIRGACVVIANMTFFLGLAAMPLASAVAIFFIAPLIITAFSVIFLGESAGPRRWIAVGIGFAGVLVMVRPGGDGFQVAALLPLVAAFAYACLHVLTRKIGGTERALTMIFYIQLTFIIISTLMWLAVGDGRFGGSGDPSLDFLFRKWGAPQQSDYIIFLLIGFASTGGGFFISQAYRLAEAGLAAPFEYVAMPLAIFWGVVIFDEWPDRTAWLGISLIIGAGVYVFWREAMQERRRITRIPQPMK